MSKVIHTLVKSRIFLSVALGRGSAQLALRWVFGFPLGHGAGGAEGQRSHSLCPVLEEFLVPEGPGMGCARGLWLRLPGVTHPERPRAGERPLLGEPMAGRGAVPRVMVTKAVATATEQLSPSGQSLPCLPSAQGTGTAQRGAFLGGAATLARGSWGQA